jgi:hypothetical protein
VTCVGGRSRAQDAHRGAFEEFASRHVGSVAIAYTERKPHGAATRKF